MGCGDSKLNTQGMLQAWVSQKTASFSHRRGLSKDQLLAPLELPDPTTPSNSMADSDHSKESSDINNETQHDDVNEREEEKDSNIEVEGEDNGEGEGIEKNNLSEDEDEREGEDSIGQCPASPSFRVYCLDNGQQMEDGDDDDDDDNNVDGSVNSHPINFRVMEAKSSYGSNDVEIMKKSEGRRKKGRKGFIQKDMFRGAGKTILHLKLPHRRASSDVGVIGSIHRQDDVKQKSKDDQAELNNRHRRHHHSQNRDNNDHHHESNHQRHRHHQKPPHTSHYNDTTHSDGTDLGFCDISSHNSHHGRTHDDENNHNNGHMKHTHSSQSDDPHCSSKK